MRKKEDDHICNMSTPLDYGVLHISEIKLKMFLKASIQIKV